MKADRDLIQKIAFTSMLFSTFLSSSAVYAEIHPTVTFGAEYIQDFGPSCTTEAGLGRLGYADNLMEYFATRMSKYGNYKKFLYSNTSAETTDLADPSDLRQGYRGRDNVFADSVDVFAIVTHGGRDHSSNNFGMSLCSSQSWDRPTREAWEDFDSLNGSWSRMRWALLFSCHSAEKPNFEWRNALGRNFEVLMGFDGLAYIGYTTDENMGDWVDDVYDDRRTFKSSWFTANEDWYVPNMNTVLVAVGDSISEAVHRRDNQTIFYPKRNGKYDQPKAFAWASKVKGQREYTYTF